MLARREWTRKNSLMFFGSLAVTHSFGNLSPSQCSLRGGLAPSVLALKKMSSVSVCELIYALCTRSGVNYVNIVSWNKNASTKQAPWKHSLIFQLKNWYPEKWSYLIKITQNLVIKIEIRLESIPGSNWVLVPYSTWLSFPALRNHY